MNVVVIKYNAGNVRSVLFALERIGINALLTDDPELIKSSDKVIFPGVGEAGSAMNYLRERQLDKLIVSLEQPVLGICLGMQLMCDYSEEGNTKCLGIFDSKVKKFQSNAGLKVPQIGWNSILDNKGPLFRGIKENEYMYFVHSYFVEKNAQTISVADYGIPYSSAIQNNNFYAVQFHPEKSAEEGQKILKNFIQL